MSKKYVIQEVTMSPESDASMPAAAAVNGQIQGVKTRDVRPSVSGRSASSRDEARPKKQHGRGRERDRSADGDRSGVHRRSGHDSDHSR